MELVNHTRYPAGLARMVYGEDRIAASVLVRVTYDIKNGELIPSEEQPWIVSNEPWEGPQGMMDGDLIFYKGGVDVFLYGSAIPEGGRPTKQMDVEIRIGSEFQRRVRVFGPRVWRRGLGGLVPTEPLPFSEMPLTLANAYGGKDVWDGLEIPWQENPEGRGFYVTEESAVDRPLPHVEELDQLVSKWDDRPEPAGLVHYPLASPLRARNGLARVAPHPKLMPRFFNAAFSRMIAERSGVGDAIEISGMSPRGRLRLILPAVAFRVHLRFSNETHDSLLAVDQVGIEVSKMRAFVAYRFPFRYIVHELQERTCDLFVADCGYLV